MQLHEIDQGLSLSPEELLSRGDLFIHGTTHATNAIVTGNTARTAFLTTKGHPDILVLREGKAEGKPRSTTSFQTLLRVPGMSVIPRRVEVPGIVPGISA